MNKKIVLFSAILGLTVLAGGLSVKASQEESNESEFTHLSDEKLISDKKITECDNFNIFESIDDSEFNKGTTEDIDLYAAEVQQEESDNIEKEVEALGKPDKEFKLKKDENYVADENKEILSINVIVNEDGTSTVQEWYKK